MSFAVVLSVLAMTVSPGDPDGVVATAPTQGPSLADALAAAPMADVVAPTAQDAAPHGLTTEQQIQRWIATRTPGVGFDESPAAVPGDDRKMHGVMDVGVGTGGYRTYGAAVSLPIGDNGRLDLAYREGRNTPYGYDFHPRGFGYGPYASPYDLGDSRSLSMGFNWTRARDRDDRPWSPPPPSAAD